MRLTQRNKSVEILKHHRTADVFVNGRYLCCDMKVSMRSKRGRQMAREVVAALTNALDKTETS